ncbi:Ger(x)C family spore germination protein [Paenibacillus alginolyticus]|uniref:Ger(x)C family spore germination protein n=1 Tax=Paenibacillus alginolyticus TaxID=59839 RepID=UPI0003FF4871|nr:Ger(x)C family spore germination protein [Paenibacillus alginolyticus]MCY9663893.1 Ger(x)C family spore germination protein [Paenibacillus alginolyticus]
MKKWRGIFLTWAALLCITGCGKTAYIEDQRFIVAEGLDLDDEKKLVMYTASPIFSREAKDKFKITKATAETVREGKKNLEAKLNGKFGPGKLQSMLLGKKLLKETDALIYLDVFFRDPKYEINAYMIVVDGALEDVVHMNMSDKGQIGDVIKSMVESSYKSRISVQTSMQKYHKQMMDSALTPSLTEMRVEKNDLVISGTALLHKDGTYAASLDNQESSLLLLLQRDTSNPIPLTFHLPPEMFHTKEEMSYVSVNIKKGKVEFKTKLEENLLTIDIQMKVQIDLVERMFTLDMAQQSEQLEQAIEQELTKECQDLIKKFQKHQLSPIGVGIHMRAHDYKNWRKVADNWGKALSEAIVNVSTEVAIKNIGVSE